MLISHRNIYCFKYLTAVLYLSLYYISKKWFGCKWTWKIIHHYSSTQKSVLYCCSAFHSHSTVFNNKHNSHPKMGTTQDINMYSWLLPLNPTSGHPCRFGVYHLIYSGAGPLSFTQGRGHYQDNKTCMACVW